MVLNMMPACDDELENNMERRRPGARTQVIYIANVLACHWTTTTHLLYNKQTNNIKESGLMAWKRARIFELAYHHLTRLRLLHIPEIQKHKATVSCMFS